MNEGVRESGPGPRRSSPIVIIQSMKEIPHGIRTQQGRADRPPRRRRHRQPAHERRPRRQSEHRDRRELHKSPDRRQGRQDRVAQGRHLPGRADRHVRQTRHQGPPGLHRRQAADPALVEAGRGRRPVLDRDPARPRRTRPVFGQAERQRRHRRSPTRPRRATPAPPLRRTSTTGPRFLSKRTVVIVSFPPSRLGPAHPRRPPFCRRPGVPRRDGRPVRPRRRRRSEAHAGRSPAQGERA